jgi:hypothetical protein
MIIVELDKYAEENYYKQAANSPDAAAPDNITHARLYYNTFASTNYIQGDFVSGSNSTVEFDNAGVTYILFKLFTSTDGTTYTERKSFGGSEGKDCVTAQQLLNAEGVTDWYLPVKKTQGGDDIIVFDSLSNIITGAGVTVTSTGVDYYVCRGILSQHNNVNSGKAFFGKVVVDTGTTGPDYTGTDITPVSSNQTLATSWSKSLSAKVSTGKYYLQFRQSGANGFRIELAGGNNSAKFENFVIPLWKTRTLTAIPDGEEGVDPLWTDAITQDEQIGTLTLDVSSDEGAQYYTDGRLLIQTRDMNGDLADNLLFAGVTIAFKAYNIY